MLVIKTKEPSSWFGSIVRAILIFNLFDALFTLVWVKAGLATEANVILRYLVNNHPILFIAAKLTIVGLATYLLWRYRHNKYAVTGLIVAFCAYYVLLLYHLRFSSQLIRQWYSAM